MKKILYSTLIIVSAWLIMVCGQFYFHLNFPWGFAIGFNFVVILNVIRDAYAHSQITAHYAERRKKQPISDPTMEQDRYKYVPPNNAEWGLRKEAGRRKDNE